jgi:hypothetical protein
MLVVIEGEVRAMVSGVDMGEDRLLILGGLVVALASYLSITARTSAGSAARSVFAYASYEGMLAVMFEMTRPLRPAGYLSAYSIASMPPQDWP